MDTWLDTFCGCGGFSLGFVDPRNKLIGLDYSEVALETYADNIKGETIHKDINEFDPSTVGKVYGYIGSPECQPHSQTNRFATHDASLIEKYLEIRDYLRPRWWIMENVPQAAKALDSNGNRIFSKGEIRFQKASDYGCLHNRKRFMPGNYPNPAKARARPRIKTPVAQIRGYGHGREDRHALKVIAAALKGTGPKEGKFNDIITVEFYAELMGFPSWYRWHGKPAEIYHQIGNAVSPKVSGAIWNAIKAGLARPAQAALESFMNA